MLPKYQVYSPQLNMSFNSPENIVFRASILQEIKDKGLTAKDKEYHRLKMREFQHRKQSVKCLCPTCGKIYTFRTLQRQHAKKCAEERDEINRINNS